jgi:U3 small nucleolar RNA-associated protein 15
VAGADKRFFPVTPVTQEMEFQPTQVKRARRRETHQPESRYWRSFKHPVFVKEFAPVTAIHFSPTAPHKYAVTVGTQVQLYAPRTNRVTKTISRFKDTARSAVIRGDGKLLAAADDTGLVQVRGPYSLPVSFCRKI